jgi:hypothetical protein
MTGSTPAYPYFGVPPTRDPRPALDEPALVGKRVILSTPEGFVYDMRAVSRIYRDVNGRGIVDIVTDEHYHRWMFTRQPPTTEAFPAHLVWVE